MEQSELKTENAMRKYILLFMALCLHIVARGQTGYTYDYWFDNDRSTMQSGSSLTGAWQMQADVSGLSEALHSIHLQVRDEEGIQSSPVTRYFYKTCMPAGSTWYCWLDDDFSNMQSGKNTNEEFILDVSQFSDGFHVLHLMVDDGSGSLSQPVARPFVKVPQTDGVDYLTCLCMIDNQLYKQEDVPAQGGVVSWQFDVSSLPQGFHHIFVQVVTPSGAATGTYQSFFMRETTREEFSQMKCVYAIDGAEFYTEAGTLADGTFHFDLDVASLSDGLHRITYLLNNGLGITTKPQTQFFMKTPLGGDGITEYWYWLNDQGDEQAQKVTLQERQNPFSLITLLPVESQPIRSSLFQFRVEQDKPVIYAKNDIHLRFYDAAGRFTDATKQFVDESVRQEVTDMTLLESGIRQTTAKPEKNAIKWYKFYAEEGDTVAFRTDQAATLQLFSPEGKNIYSASGSTSVAYGGCHTWMDGTYYVALHDVTGTKPNVTLDYMHMEKYDVVSQDAHVVGNGGCSTITFQGNGFRDLYAVDLKDSKGTIIQSIDVGHESDATTTVTFDFTGAEFGKYNAVFHFAEDNKTVINCITVEEAKDIELVTKVSFPSTFLRGTAVTYKVEIKNISNMTAYMVPLEMKLIVDNIKNVQSVQFDGYLKSLVMPSSSDFDDLEPEDIEDIRQIVANSSDLSQFIVYHDSIYGKDYGLSQVIMTLPPNSTQSFTISIKSSTNVHFEAWTTNHWFPIAYKDTSVRRAKGMRAPSRESMCCMKDKFECGAEIVANIAGAFMPPGAGCLSSLSLTGLETVYDVWCSEGNSASERWNNYLKSEGNSLANRLIQSAVTCVTGFYGARLKALREDRIMAAKLGSTSEVKRITAEIVACRTAQNSAIRSIYDGITTMILGGGCYKAFTETKPNCPSDPGGGGGSSSPVNSYDPNDIYGYIAPSGSMFVGEDVVNLPYRIEFENDTAFASSAAHTVVVKDTLDAKAFDLSSYQPTCIKIGEKKVQLKGDKRFVTTVDMRPEINAIAQVEGLYDDKKGIATWKFTSVDPMTMEATNDPMDGFLPVNTDGRGIGEISFDVSLKSGLRHRTEVSNRASIVFDMNEPIMTPVWTNIIDRITPVSCVTDVIQLNDSTARVMADMYDELSGPWRYDVYVQYGEGSGWWKAAENVPVDSMAEVRIYEGINHGFYVVATDSAGNVEQKEPVRECMLYNGITTTIMETPADKVHGISLDGTLLTVKTECEWAQRLSVVNMAGQIVLQTGPFRSGSTVSLAHLPSGIYSVSINGCGEKYARKIVVQTE